MIWNALPELLVKTDPILDPIVTFRMELDKYLMMKNVQVCGESASFYGSMMQQSSTSMRLCFHL